MKIKDIYAREVLDSRGFPTLKTTVVLEGGFIGVAGVPSGASTGTHEALELRDKDKNRFLGKGVLKAKKNVEKLKKHLINRNFKNILDIDKELLKLDGSPNKTKYGANAILGISMALFRAGAASKNLPLYKYLRQVYGIKEKHYLLPVPMLNIINGGKHADSGLNIQEFMIVPSAFKTFSAALRAASETYHTLRTLLVSKNLSVSVGDEGGFAPKLKNHEEALKLLVASSKKAGYPKMQIALDAASSEFCKNGVYYFEGKELDYKALTQIYKNWAKKYPLISLEDPLQEDAWPAWEYLTKELGKKLNIVGDDLFVTNPVRLKQGIISSVANSILIKLNQIGTVSETVQVIKIAKQAKYLPIISHRSGETEDTFIADLAVAVNAGAIKTGAPARGERTAKYNRLLEIEAELGKKARYACYIKK